MEQQERFDGATFSELGLDAELVDALTRNGYRTPTALQRAAIGPILSGHDVLAKARRGEGKTLAYLLPILQQLELRGNTQVIVVVPTRELALQVSTEARRLLGSKGLRAVALHPGASVTQQITLLAKPAQVVSGTPGRLLDLAERKALNFKPVRFVVFDELDRLLNSGHLEPMRRLLQDLAHGRQIIWIAANIDDEIDYLARKYLIDPVRIGFDEPDRHMGVPKHEVVLAPQSEQVKVLAERIREHQPAAAIVVTSRRDDVRRVSEALKASGLTVFDMEAEAERTEQLSRASRSRHPRKPAQQDSVVWLGSQMTTRAIDLPHVGLLAHYGPPSGPDVYADHVCRLMRLGSKLQKVVTLVESTVRRRIEEMLDALGLEAEWLEVEAVEPAEPLQPASAAEAAPQSGEDEESDVPVVPARFRLPVFATPGKDGLPDRLPEKTLGSKFRSPRKGMRRYEY